jgi:glycosyltransferase involved in cell wall biosynthesis
MSVSKISVAVATFNGEKYIKDQITSILSQLDENAEIIVSDDGSTDKTIEILYSFNDVRIKVFSNSEKKGPIFNFENALKKTSGDIIFLSDQDDIWLPGKINTIKKYLVEYDLVVSDCKVVDEDLHVLHDSMYSIRNSGKGLYKNLISNTYLGCCMAFNKKLLELSLPFPKKIPMHDIWLGFIADIFFSPVFIPDKLVMYRRHTQNATSTASKSEYGFYKKILFRINTLSYFPLLISRKFFQKNG